MYQPALPLDGVAGYRFLERTETEQRTAFDRSVEIAREVAHFEENIFTVLTAEALVADRTLLKVALGAFGLDEELPKKAFLEKILAEGTEDRDALANRFVDPRYAALSEAFGFGNFGGARTVEAGFGRRITDAYRERQFEVAVGNGNQDFRLALTFRREIATYASEPLDETTQWLKVLGNRPVREVLQAAFGLPSAFAGLDIDKQVATLQDRTRGLLGNASLEVFRDPAAIDQVINRFLVRRQAETGPTAATPGFAALALLQNAAASTGAINLLLSNTTR